jgi:hypothetical protein
MSAGGRFLAKAPQVHAISARRLAITARLHSHLLQSHIFHTGLVRDAGESGCAVATLQPCKKLFGSRSEGSAQEFQVRPRDGAEGVAR